MLEQEKPDTTTQQPTDSQKMTHLEGIRQKVFMDRYSLKDPSGQPLEHQLPVCARRAYPRGSRIGTPGNIL